MRTRCCTSRTKRIPPKACYNIPNQPLDPKIGTSYFEWHLKLEGQLVFLYNPVMKIAQVRGEAPNNTTVHINSLGCKGLRTLF
jgi:hypothetical protein